LISIVEGEASTFLYPDTSFVWESSVVIIFAKNALKEAIVEETSLPISFDKYILPPFLII
jgi:hypothetical protein